MDQQRRDQIERRWQEIYRKIAEAERTGESPLTGVDAAFYCDQLLEELDELEFELGLADLEERRPATRQHSDSEALRPIHLKAAPAGELIRSTDYKDPGILPKCSVIEAFKPT